MESLNLFVSDVSIAASLDNPVGVPESGMLAAGRALCLGGIATSFLTGTFGLLQLTAGGFGGIMLLAVSYFSGSLATLGVVFWVAGSLEQRLLEIKQAVTIQAAS